MILYDQDFNFIGMSAETLTFLGYEDIDEFTSMHNDFADLFVKKEGFIHKFENFSWIHYILYSGAANKKAYVRQKNGSEAPVDITIKEVFLNHTYDGLRKVYSVKLINENFTKISKTDVHDSRSKKSSEFSLQKLTKEPINLPASEPEKPEIPSTPEPVDFKLDIPEIPEPQEEVPVATDNAPQDDSQEFVLNIPPLEKSTPSQEDADDIFKLDISATPEETPAAATPVTPSEAIEETHAHMFDTLQTEQTQNAEEDVPHISFGSTQEETKEEPVELFSFDLLKKEETPVSEVSAPEADAAETEVENAEPAEAEAKPFSFDLFKKLADTTVEESTTEEASEEAADQPETSMMVPDEKRDALIDQIKHDIAEIDSEAQIDPTEQSEAAKKLQQILAESLRTERSEERSEKESAEAKEEMQIPAPEPENVPEESSQTLFSRPQKSDQEHSFEKTLQEVFQVPASSETPLRGEERSQKSNHLNLSESEAETKLSVTKESLKSQNPDHVQEEEPLNLPKLGNLGLDHEEELDFIEEFLDDTAASLSLAEEYLRLEDYDNIKYSLIKISSSAEILHFEQILEHTRSMSQQCDAKAHDALQQELETLKKTVARYKEYYATIVA